MQERFFEIGENEDYFSPFPLCTAWPELRPEDVDENLLRFTCYVAVCYTVYGANDNTIIAEHYLDLVSQLRPDMVKQLKTLKSSKAPTNYFTPNILRKSWSRLVVSVVHLDALAFPVAAT